MDLEVDFERGLVRIGEREVWVRAYPLPIDHEATRQIAQSARVHEFEEELLHRRRDFLILRVDRADLSKNVLRGFSAFDLFLEEHPEFTERVTFMAQLMPSRTDVPQYAEYLERIEALVAARLSGRYEVKDESGLIDRRRAALEEHARLAREAAQLRAQAARAKQISQRVDLNQKIKAIETAIDRNKQLMLGDGA